MKVEGKKEGEKESLASNDKRSGDKRERVLIERGRGRRRGTGK